MALTYDRPVGYTQAIPPGVRALRAVIAAHFGIVRTEVIRNLSRCQQQQSEHCVCRGLDSSTTNLVLGRRIFEFLVRNADALGIQSVIFNRRVWGFGIWYERHYDGDSPHTDHVHSGQNLWSAANLTQERVREILAADPIEGDEDMTPDQERLLTNIGIALGVGPNDAESDVRGWAADLHRELVSRSPQPPGSPQSGVGKLISGIADGSIVVKSNATVDAGAIAQQLIAAFGPTFAQGIANAVINATAVQYAKP